MARKSKKLKKAVVGNGHRSMSPVVRTSVGLCNALFDELDALRNKTTSTTRSNATARLASSIIETVRMRIEAEKHMQGTAAVVGDFDLVGNVALGHEKQ